MHIKTLLKLLVISTVMALIFAVLMPVGVLADDGIPPTEVPAPEAAATPEPVSTENAPDAAVTSDGGSANIGATEVPAMDVFPTTEVTQSQESVADITQTLADANTVLVDEQGNPIPLASQQAADLLSSTDPWFDAGGFLVGYSTTLTCAVGVTECHTTFTPIQDAINDARSTSKTIHVEAGFYTEQIMINKSLTLAGAGALSTTIQSPAILAPDANGQRSIVSIIGSGVMVDFSGFTVNGPGPSGGGFINYGIFVGGGATANIHDNAITNIRDNPFSGSQHGVAIEVGRNVYGSVGTATIDNNIIEGYQKNGITVDGAGSSAVITDNTIIGAGPTTIIAQNGIQISRGATGTIDGNTVTGNNYTPASAESTGILLYQAGNGVQVKNNTLGGPGNTANEINLSVYASNNVTISNNSITDSTSDNVDLDTVNGATFTGNKVSNSGYDGVWLGNAKNVVFNGNIFTNNANGAAAAGDPNAGAIHLGNGANPATITITNNSFTGNKNGVSNQSDLAGFVDATNNWWGNASGPQDASSVPDACGLTLNNPTGTGNAVSPCVLYSPWLTENPFASPAFAAPTIAAPTVVGNDKEHTLPTGAVVLPPAGIVPITGGQPLQISCDFPSTTAVLSNTVQMVFIDLCGYSVIGDKAVQEGLPGTLPGDSKFTLGLSFTILKDDTPVSNLPDGASVELSYPIPAGMEGKTFSVMFWNAVDGKWVEQTSSVADGHVYLSVGIPGTYVLVVK